MAKQLTDDNAGEVKIIDSAQLMRDLEEVTTTKEKVAVSNQAHGAKLKSIIELRGYHDGAFKDLARLKKKSADYLLDYKRTFLAGFQQLIEAAEGGQGDLLDQVEEEDKVVSIKAPKKSRAKREMADTLN